MSPLPAGLDHAHGPSAVRAFVALAALVALGSGAVVRGSESDDAREREDVGLAQSAISAVQADPGLRNLRLIVSVVDRVAVIGGAVPSEAHGKAVAARVRQAVPRIAEVKNRCYVTDRRDPLIGVMSGPAAGRPNPSLVLPGWPPFTDGDAAAAPGLFPADQGGNTAPDRVVVARRPVYTSENLLLAPVGVPAGGRAPVDRPWSPTLPSWAPSAPAPGAGASRSGDVLASADAVRNREPRFAGLTIAVAGGTVTISGTAAAGADAWDLAQSLRTLRGVERVQLGRVEAP